MNRLPSILSDQHGRLPVHSGVATATDLAHLPAACLTIKDIADSLVAGNYQRTCAQPQISLGAFNAMETILDLTRPVPSGVFVPKEVALIYAKFSGVDCYLFCDADYPVAAPHFYWSRMSSEGIGSTPAPGELVTVDVVNRNKRFRAALSLISDFERIGLDNNDSEPRRISAETAVSARHLLISLGAGTELPKMAPDDEGSLVMVWERKGSTVLVVVDGNRLHLAENAATPSVKYTNDLPFDGIDIPREIAKALR